MLYGVARLHVPTTQREPFRMHASQRSRRERGRAKGTVVMKGETHRSQRKALAHQGARRRIRRQRRGRSDPSRCSC